LPRGRRPKSAGPREASAWPSRTRIPARRVGRGSCPPRADLDEQERSSPATAAPGTQRPASSRASVAAPRSPAAACLPNTPRPPGGEGRALAQPVTLYGARTRFIRSITRRRPPRSRRAPREAGDTSRRSASRAASGAREQAPPRRSVGVVREVAVGLRRGTISGARAERPRGTRRAPAGVRSSRRLWGEQRMTALVRSLTRRSMSSRSVSYPAAGLARVGARDGDDGRVGLERRWGTTTRRRFEGGPGQQREQARRRRCEMICSGATARRARARPRRLASPSDKRCTCGFVAIARITRGDGPSGCSFAESRTRLGSPASAARISSGLPTGYGTHLVDRRPPRAAHVSFYGRGASAQREPVPGAAWASYSLRHV